VFNQLLQLFVARMKNGRLDVKLWNGNGVKVSAALKEGTERIMQFKIIYPKLNHFIRIKLKIRL